MILFLGCITRLYVVIVFDGCIIMDGILGIQNIIFLMFVCCRITDVVFNSIAKYILGSEDELAGALSDKVDSQY